MEKFLDRADAEDAGITEDGSQDDEDDGEYEEEDDDDDLEVRLSIHVDGHILPRIPVISNFFVTPIDPISDCADG